MDNDRLERIVAEARQAGDARARDYRQQALALFPPVCARCGRTFEKDRLRELTVHHRDHNHDNNPADGSNWELLCLYCHDNEHQRRLTSAGTMPPSRQKESGQGAVATFRPFATLGGRLKNGDEG